MKVLRLWNFAQQIIMHSAWFHCKSGLQKRCHVVGPSLSTQKYWSLFENALCSLSLALQIITAPGRAAFYFLPCGIKPFLFRSEKEDYFLLGFQKKNPTLKITSYIKSPNHLGLLLGFARHPWGCPLWRGAGLQHPWGYPLRRRAGFSS